MLETLLQRGHVREASRLAPDDAQSLVELAMVGAIPAANAERMKKARAAHVHSTDTCGATDLPTNLPTVREVGGRCKGKAKQKNAGDAKAARILCPVCLKDNIESTLRDGACSVCGYRKGGGS